MITDITSLGKMARKSNFGTLSDDLIRDRIVCGILHNAVRRRLLEQLSLTLNQCIDKCRAAEATKAQMNGSVTSGSQDEINKLRRDLPSRKPKQPSQRFQSGNEKIINCKCCGGSHEKWRESCRAFGKRCNRCGRENHFARQCKSKKQPTRVRQVDEKSLFDSSEDEVFTISSVSTDKVGTMQDKRTDTKIFATMQVGKKLVRFQVDTGATCNIIREQDLLANTTISDDGHVLTMYNETQLQSLR